MGAGAATGGGTVAPQKEHPLLVEERDEHAKADARPFSSHRFDAPEALRGALDGGSGRAAQSVIDTEAVVLDRAKGVWIRREVEETEIERILGESSKGYTLILADSGSVRTPLSLLIPLPPPFCSHAE